MTTTTRAPKTNPIPDYEVFTPGDITELIIGGPLLLVVDTCDDCGDVETVYVDSMGDLIFNTFQPDLLVGIQ